MRTDRIAANCPRRSCVRLGLHADSVQVEAQADVEGIGMAAMNISCCARVESTAPKADIEELLLKTGAVAAIQNTVRAGTAVLLSPWTMEQDGRRGAGSARLG